MDNIAEEQIIKFLEGQQKVLKEQQEEIRQVKSDLSELLKLNLNSSSNNTTLKATKEFKVLLERQIETLKYIIEVSKSINKVKQYLDTFFSKFPTKLKYQFVLGEKIKWQLYPLIAFLGFMITTSTIAYDKYSDKSDYKKAWNALLEAQSNEDYKNKLIDLLNEFRED